MDKNETIVFLPSDVPLSWHLPLGLPPLGLLPLGLLPRGLLLPPGRRLLCRRSLGRDCLGRGFLVVDVETRGLAGTVCT